MDTNEFVLFFLRKMLINHLFLIETKKTKQGDLDDSR